MVDGSPEYRFLGQPTGKKRKPGRQPDISFVRQERLPKRFRSYPDISPDLAIEVASPTDYDYQIEAEVADYQQAGVSLVWVIHPFSRTIDVYRLTTGLLRHSIDIGGTLDGEAVLPGFKLPVSDIFDYPLDLDPDPDML